MGFLQFCRLSNTAALVLVLGTLATLSCSCNWHFSAPVAGAKSPGKLLLIKDFQLQVIPLLGWHGLDQHQTAITEPAFGVSVSLILWGNGRTKAAFSLQGYVLTY